MISKHIAVALVGIASCVSGSALAQEEESKGPVTFSANVTTASDYRFRGISQTENNFALQGGVDVNHESGLYAGTWASNLAGWGTFGGSNTELDIYAGYGSEIGGIAVDGGVVWYVFPAGLTNTSYGEVYASLGKSFGPITTTIGANYAPPQSALSLDGENEDNIYVYGDASFSVGESPLSVSAHFGYSDGNEGQGPNGWVPSPTGTYLDWSLGVSYDLPWGPLAVSATYVDTDIGEAEAAEFSLINPGFRFGIGRATGFFALTASF